MARDRAVGTETSLEESWYRLEETALAERLATSLQVGLGEAEASARLASVGPNELAEFHARNPVLIFLNQFRDHGLGLNDDEGLSPSRPELRQEDPEGSVYWCDPGLWSPLDVGGELLAQGEFDQGLLAPDSKEGWDTAKEERHEFEQWPHSEVHLRTVSLPNARLILRLDSDYHRALIHRVPDGEAQWFRNGPIL